MEAALMIILLVGILVAKIIKATADGNSSWDPQDSEEYHRILGDKR